MSLVIHRTSLARFSCDRLCCHATVMFDAQTESAAVAEIRKRGWSYSGTRAFCPSCRPIIETAEA